MFDEIIQGVHVIESEQPPILIDMRQSDDFLFCEKFTHKFLLRREVCEKISAAQKLLPSGYRFIIYEAFRPRSRQIELWENILTQLHSEHPNWSDDQLAVEADIFVANPYGFGSGHQAGAAVDITLCSDNGQEFSMGTQVQEFTTLTCTDCTIIKDEEIERRNILRKVLESKGVINYPNEWWHFSYGDKLWAEITKHISAFYAPID